MSTPKTTQKKMPFNIVPIQLRAIFLTLYLALAAAYVTFAVIGGINSYSPVPIGDMWDSYINFHTEISQGNVSAWWSQHNEHRIVLSKILFWIDITFFKGNIVFLICVNYFLAFLSFKLFKYLTEDELSSFDAKESSTFRISSICFVLAVSFSWIQNENFTWGFQPQFFLAQLVPLASFWLLHKSKSEQSEQYFLLAIGTGVASAGTMANGTLTLPIMFLLSILIGMESRHRYALLITSIITLTVYFLDYHKPEHHSSTLDSLSNNPLGMLQYILCYFGGPFYYMFGRGSRIIAEVAGAIFIGLSIWRCTQIARVKGVRTGHYVLLAFIVYIGASAFATAGGRLKFGVEQAFSSRYTTPVIMAWLSLMILYLEKLYFCHQKRSNFISTLGILILVSLLPYQFYAVLKNHTLKHKKMLAALALEIKAKDLQTLQLIYPSADRLMRLSEEPAELNNSIFDNPIIKDIRDEFGMQYDQIILKPCNGSIESITLIPSEDRFVKVSGWIEVTGMRHIPESTWLIDEGKIVAGYMLIYPPQRQLNDAENRSFWAADFEGYALAKNLEGSFQIVAPECNRAPQQRNG